MQEAGGAPYNTTNPSSKATYSATLGRQYIGNRRQMHPIHSKRNAPAGMENQNVSFDSSFYKRGQISATMRGMRHQSYFPDHRGNPEADKMNIWIY